MDNRLFVNLSGAQHDYLAPFFRLHGDETREMLIGELDAICNSGIRSVCFEPWQYQDYCGEAYWAMMRFLFEECRKRGLQVWIQDDIAPPSGYANFKFREEQYQDQLPWEIREEYVDVCGPVTGGSVMTSMGLKNEGEQLLAVVASRHIPETMTLSTETVDLSANVYDGLVYFDLGEGMWRISFLVKTRQNVLPFCDKLRLSSTQVYIKEVYEKHYENLGEYFGNIFMGFFNDEAGFHNNHIKHYVSDTGERFAQYPWGDCILKGLRETYGDHAWEKLVGLWQNVEGDASREVRICYMDLLTRAFYENYSAPLAQWCHDRGIQFIGHFLEDNNAHAKTGYGCGHYFRAIGDMDMAGIDTVLHQLIPGTAKYNPNTSGSGGNGINMFYQYVLAKLGASFAHVDPRKRGRIMCESFGAYGHAEGLRMSKGLADHAMVRGVNYFVPGSYTPQETATDFPPLYNCHGDNPQLPYAKYVMQYMNRVCYLQNDGIHVPSCAIFYNAHAIWGNGDYLPMEQVAKKLYDNRYDYDILPIEYVTQIDKDGMLNGEKYPLLLLAYTDCLPTSVVEQLKSANVEVLCVSTDGKKMEGFETIDLAELPAYMQRRGLQDVVSDYEDIYLRAFHYVRSGTHIYMLANEDIHNPIKTKIRLAAFAGGDYAVYDAMRNTALRGYSEDGTIELELEPYNTVHILCGELDYDRLMPIKKWTLTEEVPFNATYQISLSRLNGAYEPWREAKALFNLTGPEGDPRFSGTAKYETVCTFPKAQKCVLDLGAVGETAEVRLNGHFVGATPVPPYAFDVTDFVCDGENKLEILVTNHLGYQRRDFYSKWILLEPSGLLGPVTVKIYREVTE